MFKSRGCLVTPIFTFCAENENDIFKIEIPDLRSGPRFESMFRVLSAPQRTDVSLSLQTTSIDPFSIVEHFPTHPCYDVVNIIISNVVVLVENYKDFFKFQRKCVPPRPSILCLGQVRGDSQSIPMWTTTLPIALESVGAVG